MINTKNCPKNIMQIIKNIINNKTNKHHFNIKGGAESFQFHPFLHLVVKKRNLGIPVVATVENATCGIFLILPIK